MWGEEGWIFVTNEQMSGHLDQTSLVNTRYIVWPKQSIFYWEKDKPISLLR